MDTTIWLQRQRSNQSISKIFLVCINLHHGKGTEDSTCDLRPRSSWLYPHSSCHYPHSFSHLLAFHKCKGTSTQWQESWVLSAWWNIFEGPLHRSKSDCQADMNGLEERSPQCASYFHTKPASNHTCKAMLLIANTLPVCGSPKNTELNMELTEFLKTSCHVFCGLVQYLKCKLKTTEINWDIVITDHDCLGFDVSSW